MNAQNSTRARLFRRSLMAAACAAAAAPAFSQSAAAPAGAASAPDAVQSVVVSGSRIKQDSLNTAAPVQIIRTDDAALAGLTTVAQILQSTAITGGQGQINNSFGNYVTNGGPGSNTIGLRGLAPERTLILLNGRRVAPSGTRGSTGSPDLNTLPASVIDHIEVLKDGASSVYGSDAIAGVINVITKRDYTGVTVDAGTTQTEHGGGNQYNFALSGGMVTDHAHFLAAYSFDEQQALALRQRGWASCNTNLWRDPDNLGAGFGGGDPIDPLTGKPKCYPIDVTGDNGVTINTIGTSQRPGVAGAGTPANSNGYTRWRPNAGISQAQAGVNGLAGYEGVSLDSRDTFDPRTLNSSLLSPVKTHNLFFQGGVDVPGLGDTAEFYWEAMYNRRESSQVGYRQLSLDYAKGSPLIPDNLAFSQVQAAPTAITNGAALGVRAFIGQGNSNSDQSVNFQRYVAGLRGDIAKIGWDYDVSLTHTESRGTYTFDGFQTSKLANSLNVVSNGAGGFNCVNTQGGCVAAPVLSSQVIGGVLPQAWLNYVMNNDITGVTKYKEDVLTASTTGDIYKLPFGTMKGAFGVEFRRNFIDDTPSDVMSSGDFYNFSSATQTRGSDSAKDIFGEVEIPILKKLPFAEDLTVTASIRRSDYRSYGAGTTHKFGALYSPVSWFSFRGSAGTSYRAPALFEQYVGATTGFLSSTTDPCNDYGGKTGTVAANCASENLPQNAADPDDKFEQHNSVEDITNGGRGSGLKAETSKNTSLGMVFNPTLPTGWGEFQMSFDHYNIRVNNGIDRAGVSNILDLCYNDPNFRGEGGSPYCRLVTRNADSSLSVNDSYINLATNVTRGNDYQFEYNNTLPVGKLHVKVQASQFLGQANKLFSTDPYDDVNGNIGSPKWSGAMQVGYTLKGWNATWSTEYVGKQNSYGYLEEDAGTSQYLFKTPDYFLHSLALSYDDSVSKIKVTVGVRNVFDKNPPSISSGYYDKVGNAPLYSGYDYFGRSFFASVSKSF